MIGKVSGRLDYRGADHVLIDAGGLGYVVHCSDRTLAAMPAPGEAVALYTELLVREDLLQLFGFMTLAAVVMALFSRSIAAAYTNDPQVAEIAVQLLFMAALFQVFDGLQVAGAGALRGLKDTAVPMVMTCVALSTSAPAAASSRTCGS